MKVLVKYSDGSFYRGKGLVYQWSDEYVVTKENIWWFINILKEVCPDGYVYNIFVNDVQYTPRELVDLV